MSERKTIRNRRTKANRRTLAEKLPYPTIRPYVSPYTNTSYDEQDQKNVQKDIAVLKYQGKSEAEIREYEQAQELNHIIQEATSPKTRNEELNTFREQLYDESGSESDNLKRAMALKLAEGIPQDQLVHHDEKVIIPKRVLDEDEVKYPEWQEYSPSAVVPTKLTDGQVAEIQNVVDTELEKYDKDLDPGRKQLEHEEQVKFRRTASYKRMMTKAKNHELTLQEIYHEFPGKESLFFLRDMTKKHYTVQS